MNSLNNKTMTNREKIHGPKVNGTLVTKENRNSKQCAATISPGPKPFSRWIGSNIEFHHKTLLMIKFMNPLRNFMDRIHVINAKQVLKENIRNAFRSDHYRFRIDCGKVILSKGNLPVALRMSVSSSRFGKLVFVWTDNGGIQKALPTDRLFVAIFNRESKTWIFKVNAAPRSTGYYSMEAGRFQGKPVQVYAGFVSLDSKRISTSLYLGEARVS
jgi:hypothetical protein